jgi:hypothetical protein
MINGSSRDRRGRLIAAGAALVAVPVAGMFLYVKHRALAAPAPATGDSIDAALEKLRQIDPAHVGYREVGRINTGLSSARAIALDERGRVLAAGERSIRLIKGGEVKTMAVAATPNALAAEGGQIYAAFGDHVEVYDFEGARKATWAALPRGALVTGIAVAGDDVYLADSGRRLVVRADRTGKVVGEIGKADAGRGVEGLLLPSPHLGVAAAADGTIWVNDSGRHRMENYTAEGNLERYWGGNALTLEGFVGCCNPIGFALLKDGSFVTVEKSVARVKHYLADGRFDGVVAGPEAFTGDAPILSITSDSQGRVLVLERGTGLVHVYERIEKGGAS